MTEPAPQAPAAPSPQAAELNADQAEAQAQARGERIGTILMAVAIAGVIIIAADVAFKGKLLAPLFALLPAPRSSTIPEATDDTPPAAGD